MVTKINRSRCACFSICRRIRILLLFCLAGIPESFAADAAFCDAYSKNAVQQFGFAKERGMPDVTFPRWSGDYNHHYQWCLKAKDDDIASGARGRGYQLQFGQVTYQKHSYGKRVQQAG